MIIAPVLAILSPLPAITLDEVLALPPYEAGEQVLRGVEHGRVQAVVRPPLRGLQPPNTIDLELVEQGVEQPRGCSRKRWRTMFQHGKGDNEGSAQLTSRYAGLEVARTCDAKQFTHLNSGLSPDQALGVLERLEQISAGRARVRFTCADPTESGLCADDRTTRSQLSALEAWAVTRRNGALILWLGTPGQVVTEVRFNPRAPDHVFVERRMPAPA